MLTQERADILSKYLADNTEKAKKLFELSPEEVVDFLKADGLEFSVDEIIDYGHALQNVMSKDELDSEDLDAVSGGAAVSIGIMVACGVGGLVAGYGVRRFACW